MKRHRTSSRNTPKRSKILLTCVLMGTLFFEIQAAPKKQKLSILWSLRVPGAVSSLSGDLAGGVLVATNPDPDIEGSSTRFLLTRISPKGKILWQKTMDDPVKEQDLSSDGKLAVISNYGDQLILFNERGKVLWSNQGTCKPYFLNFSKKILCYHDEDVDAKVAFELFDYSGKRIKSFGITGDILSFKLALD
ncbi:MAG: hypothetical protein HYX41_07620, partial [Bdellovibrio sp.]|nr:hypothetical protein [Bdellovibrio sp.]